MLRLLMSGFVALLFECLIAPSNLASIGFLASVSALVVYKAGSSGEGLLTDWACK
jgi:hypothetical protein